MEPVTQEQKPTNSPPPRNNSRLDAHGSRGVGDRRSKMQSRQLTYHLRRGGIYYTILQKAGGLSYDGKAKKMYIMWCLSICPYSLVHPGIPGVAWQHILTRGDKTDAWIDDRSTLQPWTAVKSTSCLSSQPAAAPLVKSRRRYHSMLLRDLLCYLSKHLKI